MYNGGCAYVVEEQIELMDDSGNKYFEKSDVMCICETEEDAILMAEFFTNKGLPSWKQDHYWKRLSVEYVIIQTRYLKSGEAEQYCLPYEGV